LVLRDEAPDCRLKARSGVVDQVNLPHSVPIKILLMTDDKPGHYHLAEGVIAAVRRLRTTDVTRILVRRKWIVPTRFLRARLKARTYLPPRMLRMAYRIKAEELPKVDLVISAGGETLMPNICASRYLGVPNIFCGSLLHRLSADDLHLVISSYRCDASNDHHLVVLKPSAIDPDALGRSAFSARYGPKRHPRVAGLLVGGNAGPLRYRRAEWKQLLNFVGIISETWGTRWLISTSRRTPESVANLLVEIAKDQSAVARFIDFRTEGPGTLPEVFASAEVIVCTEDSSSMISEAISARLPVVAARPSSHSFTDQEQEYRNFLIENDWYRVLPIANLTPENFAAALSEINPIQENPLDILAMKLKERLPQLF
jgi:hypothetical protein